MGKRSGLIGAGNQVTAEVGAEILAAGGNAFDAVIAAAYVAAFSEPVLTSIGGGGFLMARPVGGEPALLDFFGQTPGRTGDGEALDFYASHADFGTTHQEFHIGRASVGVPGFVAGMAAIHDRFGTLPMPELIAPAATIAREGHRLHPLQARTLIVVAPIMLATASARAIYEDPENPGHPWPADSLFKIPEAAAVMEAIAAEGPELFYKGDLAHQIAEFLSDGGLVTQADLACYEVRWRRPAQRRIGPATCYTNPPPSLGGPLILFTLALLDRHREMLEGPLSATTIGLIAGALRQTAAARKASGLDHEATDAAAAKLFEEAFFADYDAALTGRAVKTGGTTHLSVVDADGNLAAMTLSNGEGMGEILPGTGIMLNNLLGEADINPAGFFKWQPNTRISSMMAPTLVVWDDGRAAAFGSGGSNRIRSVLAQTAARLVLLEQSAADAVAAPRMHFEDGLLNIEETVPDDAMAALAEAFPERQVWPRDNLFFGGVHMVTSGPDGIDGAADFRRAGVTIRV